MQEYINRCISTRFTSLVSFTDGIDTWLKTLPSHPNVLSNAAWPQRQGPTMCLLPFPYIPCRQVNIQFSDIMLKWRFPFKPTVSCNRKKSHRLHLLFPLIIKFFFFNFKAKPSPSLLTLGLLCIWTPPESREGKQLQWESWSGRNNQLPDTQRPHSWQPDTV